MAIKSITKKNLSKSKNLLGKEIKILRVRLAEKCVKSYLSLSLSLGTVLLSI